MQKLPWGRRVFLAVGILSILLLVLLAASLDTLKFKKGTPFSYATTQPQQLQAPSTLPNVTWFIIGEIVVFAIIIVIALTLVKPKQRGIILLGLLFIGLTLLAIMWDISTSGGGVEMPSPTPRPTATVVQNPAGPSETLVPLPQATPVLYRPPKILPWISLALTFSALFVVVLLFWLSLQYRWKDTVPLDELAGIAGRTVSDLQAGMDYGDAILNCYAGMVAAVNKHRDIRRRGSLTPAEFVAVLERAHLPSAPVHRLTMLFEKVRYGGNKPSRAEIDEALACLNDIVAACQEVR
ncbi:MAG: DUF4129 domain-containing protein [Anaerolineales bacterium]